MHDDDDDDDADDKNYYYRLPGSFRTSTVDAIVRWQATIGYIDELLLKINL